MDNESYINEYYEKHNWGEYIQKHHRSYLAMAWGGHQRIGRGFVVLDFNKAVMDTNDAIMEMPVEYLTADELVTKENSHPDIVRDAHRIANLYDPEAEMAICQIIPLPYQPGYLPSLALLGINGTFPIRQIYEEEKG